MSINQVGEKFDLQKLISAQNETKIIVHKVATQIKVGMSEQDCLEILNKEFKTLGDLKFWHPHKFRIGKNTLCSFKEESDSTIRLQENDHFFIDVGPILYEHEADYGETFIVGKNDSVTNLKNISEKLFQIGKENFLNNKLSGKDLYTFLEAKASDYGVVLNMKTLGHRVGDFPHHVFYRGKMAEVEESLVPNIWVLEIQIANIENTSGAFFEDILFA